MILDRHSAWRLGAIVAVVTVVWCRTLDGSLLWDDGLFVEPHAGAQALIDPWLGRTVDYFPLTSSMFWIEGHIWGGAPVGYHLMNLALHAGCCVVLWRILVRLHVPAGEWAVALFAVHPLCGATVGWIAEQKNVLSLLLALLALRQHLVASETGSRRGHLIATMWFVLAMLAKPAVAGLPVLAVAIDGWRNKRLRRADVLAIAPWLVAAVVLGMVTVHLQAHPGGPDPEPTMLRFARAPLVAAHYFGSTLWPRGLAMVYDRAPFTTFHPAMAIAWVGSVAIVVVCAARFRSWGRPAAVIAVGWLAMLGPVLGLVPMSFHRYSFVSDHLAYPALPVLLAGIAAASRAALGARANWLLGALTVLCGVLGFQRAAVFRSQLSLWEDSVAHAPGVAICEGNLALALDATHDGRAIEHAERAIALDARDPDLYAFAGVVYLGAGRTDDAEHAFVHALVLEPAHAKAHNNLATILAARGDLTGAIAHLQAALRSTPNYPTGHLNLARLLAAAGRMREAREEWDRAVALDSSLARYPLAP